MRRLLLRTPGIGERGIEMSLIVTGLWKEPPKMEIVITCPTTGNDVPTGIAMDQASFDSAALRGNSFTCPACGKVHAWDKKDARVKTV